MKIALVCVLIFSVVVNGRDYGDYIEGPVQPDYGQEGQGSDNGVEVGDFPCSEDGIFADPTDDSKFHQCANGIDHVMICPDGTLWDDGIKSCRWTSI